MGSLKELKSIRRQYTKDALTEGSISKNPFAQFKKWFSKTLKSGFFHPNAMTLATASKNGKPSARIVLLKGFDENGFIFYTNYTSRKAKELDANPYASLLFYWDKLERQVRIEGKIRKVTKKESEQYFSSRPFNSRIGAWASDQSSVIKNRSVLVNNFSKYLAKFKNEVPLPSHWGGYRLIPSSFEFWQGRANRLHDRIRYTRQKNGWRIERLAP